MRVGMVLGGGGMIGLAYHASALAAMEVELRWDPRSADVIVGTSAGSVIGGLLRRGVSATDLSAVAVGAEAIDTPPDMAQALRERPDFPPMRLGSFLQWPRLPSRAFVASWVRRPWRLDPLAALVSVLPDGSLDLAEHTTAVERLLGDTWPDQDLWVCVVRQEDLRRVVFGRDSRPALTKAVCASAAVPGYFQPVLIDGRTYIDGGVRSPTNASVLRARELDAVFILSPMSGRDLGYVGVANVVRRRARRTVQAERRRLARAGIPTVLIEPGPEVTEAMGTDFMSATNASEIANATFLDTRDQLRKAEAGALLADVRTQGRASPRRHMSPNRLRRPPHLSGDERRSGTR